MDISASQFKAKCLDLMDVVAESGGEYVITKHGKPVAKLVPYQAPEALKSPFGFWHWLMTGDARFAFVWPCRYQSGWSRH